MINNEDILKAVTTIYDLCITTPQCENCLLRRDETGGCYLKDKVPLDYNIIDAITSPRLFKD